MSNLSKTAAQKAMGQRLRAVREIMDFTQSAFGDIAGVGDTTIQGWESGRNMLDIVALAKLAKTVGFSLDYIANNDLAGLRFDVAVKLQQRERIMMGMSETKPARRSRVPTVREAADNQKATKNRTLNDQQAPYVVQRKST